MSKLVWILFLLLSFLVASDVWAVGVAVKPTQLDLQGTTMRSVAGELLVVNIDRVPALYQMSADEFSDIISFDATDFQLQPQESRIVRFKGWFSNPGTFQTSISVAAKPLGNAGLAAASGVKVPVVIVISGVSLMMLVGGIISFCLLLTILLVVKLKTKQSFLKNNR